MISDREKKILNILIENNSRNLLTTSLVLASELGVTTKTIQHDIREIDDFLNEYDAAVATVTGKGYKLEIDEQTILKIIGIISDQQVEEFTFSSQDERSKYIAAYLIFAKKPVLSDNIAYNLYVSRSQLSNDIRRIKEILEPYGLKLVSRSKLGITVEGNERNKRRFLLKEGINYRNFTKDMFAGLNRMNISDIVMDAMANEKYKISDFDLQRFILNVEITIVRVQWGESLNDYEFDTKVFPDTHEYRIVQEIFTKVNRIFPIGFNEYEVANLASLIQSVRILVDNSFFSEEAEQFVEKLLPNLKRSFGIDFTMDMELKMNLAIHFTSLLVRARNGTLAENSLTEGIKQSLTLPYDIAAVTAHMIEQEFAVKLSDDEAGYIAVYFAVALNHIRVAKNKKRVLLITSSRKSEALLLRHNFLSHFENDISSLEVVQASELNSLNSEDYDCVFATCFPGMVDTIRFNAIHIDYFFSGKDLITIENQLKQGNASELLQFFDEELFFHNVPAKDKYQIISFLCRKMNEKYHFDKEYGVDLYQNIINREEAAPTVFAKSVALPHPEIPFSDSTITAVAVLDEPVLWNQQEVQIIFLTNIKKDGEREMDILFGFFSEFISDINMKNKLKKMPSFQTLKEILASYKHKQTYDL